MGTIKYIHLQVKGSKMYDLLIRNGTIVDGSGGARYPADLAIQDGKIAAIGRINEKSRQTIDAEGHVVSPGFVDGHTHMDAQVFLGSVRCVFVLSRRDQRGHGELWIYAGTV